MNMKPENKRKIIITLADNDMRFDGTCVGVTCSISIEDGPKPEVDTNGVVTNPSAALMLMDRMLHAANQSAESMMSEEDAVKACEGHSE